MSSPNEQNGPSSEPLWQGIIEEPHLSDTLEIWDRHLASLRLLHKDTRLKNAMIERAEELIAEKKKEAL